MRTQFMILLLAGAAGLAGCATVPPATAYNACSTYGQVDRDNDGFVTSAEWNAYRTGAYTYWDVNRDGRISRAEFENCWYAGGFYADNYYRRDYWQNYWTGFDTNRDGYLSADEYWSAAAWTRADRNNNGRIDADEWQWWMGG